MAIDCSGSDTVSPFEGRDPVRKNKDKGWVWEDLCSLPAGEISRFLPSPGLASQSVKCGACTKVSSGLKILGF